MLYVHTMQSFAELKSMNAMAIVADLLFTAKIQSAAREAGVEPLFPRTRQQIEEAIAAGSTNLVLVDLETRWVDTIEVIRHIKDETGEHTPTVVAFGPHLNTAKLQAASEAGADRVLTRSTFVTELRSLFG